MTRIWDKYLSERDRRHIAGGAPWPTVKFGRRPLLLLVDNYKAALGEERRPFLEAVADYPWSTGEEGWNAVAKTTEVLALFRQLALPVVHVTSVRPSDGVPRSYDLIHDLPMPSPHDDHLYEIVPALAPTDGEVVFRKACPSAFNGTTLLTYLRHLDVDTLVVCGEATSGCIRATVTDAASFCFRVFIVEECVYDRHEAAHAINLFDMDRKYGSVVSMENVLGMVKNIANLDSLTKTQLAER